jgi:NADH dehydrogenase FAD-containing subunit
MRYLHCNIAPRFVKIPRDARKIRSQLMDCLENAAFPGQSDAEVNRLLHMVVVGGGPTGVEYAAELYDFLHQDLVWHPFFGFNARSFAHYALDINSSNGTQTLLDALKLRLSRRCLRCFPCSVSN